MRAKSFAFNMIASWCCDSFGATSSSSFWSASSVLAPVSALKTTWTRVSVWPLRSSATRVLSKVGGLGLLAMVSTSAICSRMPASKAGAKSVSLILSNGVAAKGRAIGVSRGFVDAPCGSPPGGTGRVPGVRAFVETDARIIVTKTNPTAAIVIVRPMWAPITSPLWGRDDLAVERRQLGRCFGAWRFAERFHRNRCVLDVEDLEVFGLRWGAQDDAVARARLHERARQRRPPADVAPVQVHLVDADNAEDVFVADGVLVGDGRPEEHARRCRSRPRRCRVNDFGRVDPFRQEANAGIDVTQPALAVEVVGVLAAVAVAGGPRDDLRHRRPLPVHQEPV